MRTTIDLPDDVHHAAMLIARDRQQTLSRTVSQLLRSALGGGRSATTTEIDEDSGLPTVRVARRITIEDVAGADDDG